MSRPSEDGGYVTAALGTTWSHSVNTRLILQYLDGHRRQVNRLLFPHQISTQPFWFTRFYTECNYVMALSVWLSVHPSSCQLCWNTVNSNLRNKLQGNLKQNSYIFIQANALKTLSAKWSQNLFRPQCVNILSDHCLTSNSGMHNSNMPYLPCQSLVWFQWNIMAHSCQH